MHTPTLTHVILLCISALTMLIAGAAFVLSYVNLRQTAISAGVPADLAFLWPVCLDAFLILASLDILRANLTDESPKWGWIILISFTMISTGFNMMGSLGNSAGMLAHALPPVALCISLEVLMRIAHRDAHSLHTPVQTVQGVHAPVQTDAHRDQEPCKTDHSTHMMDTVVHYYRAHPCTPYQQAARDLKKHRTSIARRVQRAISDGLLDASCLPPKKGSDDTIQPG
jgi:hypothetical protein